LKVFVKNKPELPITRPAGGEDLNEGAAHLSATSREVVKTGKVRRRHHRKNKGVKGLRNFARRTLGVAAT